MISEFIINVSILMAFTFIWHEVFRHQRLTFLSPIGIKLADGFIAGILGIILMHYSISVNEITILDLRHIPVILVAFYGGVIPSIIAAIVISIGRFLIAINLSSFTSLFMMLLIAIGVGLISIKFNASAWKKWTILTLYSQFIFSIALYYVVEDFYSVLDYAFFHFIISIGGGFITFYFVRYIRRNSEMYLKYKQESFIDHLTGISNVRGFDQTFNKVVGNAQVNQDIVSICLIDVDHFKEVNDTFGHQSGDEILKKIAYLLKQYSPEHAYVSRNGGEEFSIVLDKTSLKEVVEVAENIRKRIETHSFSLPKKESHSITVSIGIASNNFEIYDPNELIAIADDALYKAKHSGRNTCVVY